MGATSRGRDRRNRSCRSAEASESLSRGVANPFHRILLRALERRRERRRQQAGVPAVGRAQAFAVLLPLLSAISRSASARTSSALFARNSPSGSSPLSTLPSTFF